MAIPFIEGLLLSFLLALLLHRFAESMDNLTQNNSDIWHFSAIVIGIGAYPAIISALLARHRPIWFITLIALIVGLFWPVIFAIVIIPESKAPVEWLQHALTSIRPSNAVERFRDTLWILPAMLSITLIAVGLAAAWFKQRPDCCCRQCYYELQGLTPNETGAIRCPECALLAPPLDANALSPRYRLSMWLLTANILTLILLFLF